MTQHLPETETHKKDLEFELKYGAGRAARFGYGNYTAAYVVALLAVGGSITAAILAAVEANKVITASIAIIPAAVAAFTRVFNFEQKALWHWRKAERYRALLRSLRWEGADIKEVSQRLSYFSETHDGNWVKLDPLIETQSDTDATRTEKSRASPNSES